VAASLSRRGEGRSAMSEGEGGLKALDVEHRGPAELPKGEEVARRAEHSESMVASSRFTRASSKSARVLSTSERRKSAMEPHSSTEGSSAEEVDPVSGATARSMRVSKGKVNLEGGEGRTPASDPFPIRFPSSMGGGRAEWAEYHDGALRRAEVGSLEWFVVAFLAPDDCESADTGAVRE
jgi:hypothetical protein